MGQAGSRPPKSDHDPFLVQVWPWKHLGTASRSNHWTDCHRLWYKTHFSSHITIWFKKWFIVVGKRKKTILLSKGFFFSFGQLMRAHTYPSFLTFTICCKCWTAIKWSVLSASGTSHLAVRGSLWWSSQLIGVNFQWPATVLIFKGLFSPAKTSWTSRCTVLSLPVPGPHALLMLPSCLFCFRAIWTWIK